MTTLAIHGELCDLVVRVRSLVVIIHVTALAGVGGVVVIPSMTDGAIVLNSNMGTRYRVIIIMNGKAGRFPARVGRMAGLAIIGNSNAHMIRIDRLVVVRFMAGKAYRWRTRIAVDMAQRAVGIQVSAGQRKVGIVVIKTAFCGSVRMTFQACRAVVGISTYLRMFIAGFSLLVAGKTCELGIIGWVLMAFRTGIPFPVVFPGIDREILPVMIKGRGDPGINRMAGFTTGGKL